MSLKPVGDLEGQFLAVPSVKPLRLVDTWKAATTWFNALEGDPLNVYIRATSKPLATKATYFLILLLWMKSLIILTINAGAALIVANPIKTGPSSSMDRLVDLITKWTTAILYRSLTEEQKKRRDEIDEKVTNLTKNVLGDRTKEMIYVDLLVTEPRSQRHGYGSALLQTMTSYGDSLVRAVWLQTATHQNVLFYKLFGFEVLGETVLGDDNPEWHQDPVILRLMVREPKAQLLVAEKRTTFQ
ncbi:hypothetical protein CPB84DRAFT_61817 [Gymnopilus junonius]|uniref:N-acetyltransferase domain-containing protein n=1 Tax=Gymnopilus junonius TaxID=109634 RepID=A0A9P5P3J0_GYMJU|nr:hypothetical protein CPB84DRAFT_61817 [Gymnopilus junonius]